MPPSREPTVYHGQHSNIDLGLWITYLLDRLSHASRLAYITVAAVPGTPGVAEELGRCDAVRYELQAAALGGDPRYPGARYCSTPAIANGLVMPARRWSGPGWASAVDVWPAAFVGAVGMVVSRLVDRPTPSAAPNQGWLNISRRT